MINHLDYLRDAHARGVLVPFVGAGLGASAANLPSWPALLTEGISYVISATNIHDTDLSLQKITSMAAGSQFVEAFSELARLMSGDPEKPDNLLWESFIAEQFAKPMVVNTELLDALSYLECLRIVTTNYDQLLEAWQVGSGRTLTWQDAAGIRDAFRLGSGVVHLHGVWNRPDSIVLSQHSYDSITRDAPARQVARVIFHGSVLLFIGTSLDGTHDPHLGELLAEFESLADRKRGEHAPHIMLVRGSINGTMRARWNRQGIEVVSYGDEYSDLPEFIRAIPGDTITSVDADSLTRVFRSVVAAPTLDFALQSIADWIEREVFVGRKIRISFAEKVANAGGDWEIQRRSLNSENVVSSPHNYPLSMSGWSLVEGTPIEWPRHRSRRIAVEWLKRCNKYEQVDALIANPDLDEVPELKRYVDIKRIRELWSSNSLTLGDFFQDWASDQLRLPYNQFVTVPVPWLETVQTRESPIEYGVFNIDTLESIPLMTYRTSALLRLASEMTMLAFSLRGNRSP